MNRPRPPTSFTVQLTPELLIKLTPDEELAPELRKSQLNKPIKPKLSPTPPPETPPPPPPPPPAWTPPPPVPPFFASGFLPGVPTFPAPEFKRYQHHDGELESIRSVLAECETVVEKLHKQEEVDLEEVKRRVREMQEKRYKAPEPRPIPCLADEQACIRCYKENPSNPLKCEESVRAYVKCARQAQERFVAAGLR